MADDLVVDHVVPPAELRSEIVKRFEFFAGKVQPIPERKHGAIL
ncbi:MAG: hypothetical protein ACYDCK_15605 [Thermoplasmatota archaeon]